MKSLDRFDLLRLEASRDVREALVEDVRAGLSSRPKTLPPRYFYDGRGSELFVEITRQPEYYPTRTEAGILKASAGTLIEDASPEEICELGSGASEKTRRLLEAMHAHGSGHRYVAFDVSEDAIVAAARTLVAAYPWLTVVGVVGDFSEHLEDIPRGGRRLVTLLGSTIGNLSPAERESFLPHVARMLQDGDRFLCGFDLVKDVAILEAAYDDAAGVTAEFNRNVIRVLNRELTGDLPVEAFEHRARWNADEERMEMWLRAVRPVDARLQLADLDVHFDEGEEMLTELSCKFTRDRVDAETARAGLHVERWTTDENGWFALALCRRA